MASSIGLFGRVGVTLTVFLALCAVEHAGAGDDGTTGFEGSHWIWTPHEGKPITALGAGTAYFRAEVSIPESPGVESAEIVVTCDNLFVMYLNGQAIGESETGNDAWRRARRYDVTHRLTPGQAVLAVEAINTLPGPAGLCVRFVARMSDGSAIVRTTDATWKASAAHKPNWQQPDFNDGTWQAAQVVGAYGASPWGRVTVPTKPQRAGQSVGQVRRAATEALSRPMRAAATNQVTIQDAPPDFDLPDAIVFVGEDCSLYRARRNSGTAYDSLSVTIFNPRRSRAFPEHDLPAPMKVGRKLYVMRPADRAGAPRMLLDAGEGALGSPTAAFDGKSILVSMAYGNDPFFHIYRVAADGGAPVKLTDGPFHDIDPAELPDGRIVFTSTRIGTFEEYHSPPSRSLFVMNADGKNIRPLTYTIIFDNEPEVLADGRIVFVRSDNFFDRGKVETRLHAINPDGTRGYTEFGLENGPEYGNRLRAYVCGSPAPMPDGRLAFLSAAGVAVGRPGATNSDLRHLVVTAGDVSALPDGRLLCTVPGSSKPAARDEVSYESIGVLDPDSNPPAVSVIYNSKDGAIHSPVFLGPRSKPPALIEHVDPKTDDDPYATGYLYCEDVRTTLNTTAGWPHVRAIRVLAGKGLTVRSSHSYIVHAGNETVELGTVPIAPDGSIYVEVPANTPLALQAVDAEGRSELNEMSWIYVRPGERRGCVGCHAPRQQTPRHDRPMPIATLTEPLKLLGRGENHRFRGNNAAVTGLMELQFDRYREVAGLNRYGDERENYPNDGNPVERLIQRLDDDRASERIAAAQRLAVFRDPVAAPALAPRLDDSDREMRVAAAIALAACGTRESITALIEALTDRDALVAQAAAMALENLTGHARPFDAFASRGERMRQAEAWRAWLESTTWDGVERALIARLSSDDRDVVRRAAVALGHIGSAAAHAPVRAYVAKERLNNPYPQWRKANHRGDRAQFNSLDAVNPRTLQAATRSLGYLRDADAVPLLAETLASNVDPNTGNLFLAEAAAEALGRIATPDAEGALIDAFARLPNFPDHTLWYGDHPALMSCHAAPVHYFIIEALDRIGSTRAGEIVPHLIRSVPIDPDRALFLCNDDYEALVGRVIRRQGAEADVVESCLALLGDPTAKPSEPLVAAISKTIRCWAGHPDAQNRAAQILSLVCRDRRYTARIVSAFERYRARETTIPRVFDKGIPQVQALPVKHWVCFYLARALGNLSDPAAAQPLIAALEASAPEAASGRPDPLGPGVLFLHNDLTPCWRAAVAWALGRLGDRRAVPVLLSITQDLDNATDTRAAAVAALGRIGDPESIETLGRLAADYAEVSVRRAMLEMVKRAAADRPTPPR